MTVSLKDSRIIYYGYDAITALTTRSFTNVWFLTITYKITCVVGLDINNHDDQTTKTLPSSCVKSKRKQYFNMA